MTHGRNHVLRALPPFQSRLSEIRPRLSEIQSRLPEIRPRLPEIQSRRLKNRPRLSENQSRLSEIQLRLSENQLRRLKPRFRPRGNGGNGLPLPTQAANRRKPAAESAKKRVKCLERTKKPSYLCAKIE